MDQAVSGGIIRRKLRMVLYYKQAIDISVEIQEIFEQMFAISGETQEEELQQLAVQLRESVKRVISVFCQIRAY